MTPFRFLQLDVFTEELFGGNQLAVLPDARGIPDDLMQRIAREMAFSETTFVLPAEAEGTDLRVRIFTPGSELPMAGHPTIGTAFALAQDGIIRRGQRGIVFGEGIGPVPVDLEWHDGQLAFAWMTQPSPTFGQPMNDVAAIAATIGLDEQDIRATRLPVQEVSSGAPFVFIPIATRAAVDRAMPDVRAMRRLFERIGSEAHGVYIFTTDAGSDGATTYSRMFSADLGIPEDPATGGACGPLGAYLVRHGVVPATAATRMLNLQGVKMLRPSLIHMSIDPPGSAPVRPRVGGTSVLAAQGTINIPI
jgi:trans-2,3-dihydro-3-hydroxyanthranilate isomerase